MKTVLVTGGAGFIGSCAVREWIKLTDWTIVVVDSLTYAGNLESLAPVSTSSNRVHFVHADIRSAAAIRSTLHDHRPDAIVHFAAESHVDRSINDPEAFVQTNVMGTFVLLDEARRYWEGLPSPLKSSFRFHHVSTDEVFGTLGETGLFSERTAYAPNSPYSASKAGSDHLVRAWYQTYGLPVLISHCANNYGPFQFPEKLIPLMILNGLAGEPLPLYGDGRHVRDWIHVEDHVNAIRTILERGAVGETYCIGGRSERTNLEAVTAICNALDAMHPDGAPHDGQIRFVPDRPGHDRRNAIDCSKIEQQLGWNARENFQSGIRKTVQWYVENPDWVNHVRNGDYRRWVDLNYGAKGNAEQHAPAVMPAKKVGVQMFSETRSATEPADPRFRGNDE